MNVIKPPVAGLIIGYVILYWLYDRFENKPADVSVSVLPDYVQYVISMRWVRAF